jgi:hypothetical protein
LINNVNVFLIAQVAAIPLILFLWLLRQLAEKSGDIIRQKIRVRKDEGIDCSK